MNIRKVALILGLVVFVIWWFDIFGPKESTKEGVTIWPTEIPGHRPSLGDFLVTDGDSNVENGYEREDDV